MNFNYDTNNLEFKKIKNKKSNENGISFLACKGSSHHWDPE